MHILFLVGPRGCGKSHTAKALAQKCQCPALDTDDVVMKATGKTIARIVAEEGWPAFRVYERAALRQAVDILYQAMSHNNYCGMPPNGVIATGGGMILDPENRSLMTRTGIVVYLKTPVELLVQRMQKAPKNAYRPPLSKGQTLAEEVAATVKERDPLYRQTAHHVLDASVPLVDLVEELYPIFVAQANR